MNNREIKFRIWDKQNKYFINAFSLNFGFALAKYVTFSMGLNREDFESKFIIHQFTGLKDENGKEIYEGDIMASRGNYITDEMDEDGNFIDIYNVVVWNKRATRFALKPIDEYLKELKNPPNPELDHPWVCNITTFKEVVGNICENEDMLLKLLKKQKKDEEKARKHLEDITSECEACGEDAMVDGFCNHCGHEER